jgi:hypothetical protein
MVAYLKPCHRRSAKGKGKICASGCEPGNVETLLKKGKRLLNKPEKPDLVTRQEMPACLKFKVQSSRLIVQSSKFKVQGSRFKVQGSRLRMWNFSYFRVNFWCAERTLVFYQP